MARNLFFLHEILDTNPGIFCGQEHWMRSFEEILAMEYCQGREIHFLAKDADKEEVYERYRADRGGVFTTWDPSLNKFAKKQKEDSTDRILVTTFETASSKLCIVNCYLPSGNTPEAVTRFTDDIARISELIDKYHINHDVILVGDLNADHYHRPTQNKEKMLLKLIKDHELYDLGSLEDCTDNTYNNIFLGHHSRVDHMLIKSANVQNYHDIRLHGHEDASNTSSHTPLKISCNIMSTSRKCQNTEARNQATGIRFEWNDADPADFTGALHEYLNYANLDLVDNYGKLNVLLRALNAAAIATVPYRKTRPRKSPITKAKFTPELKAAVAESKEAYSCWKAEGKPEESEAADRNKAAKKRVRSIQRTTAAIERGGLLKDISQAHADDQQLMHAVIKRQRSRGNHAYSLLIDDVHIDDPEKQRDGFADYYEKLATAQKEDRMSYLVESMRALAAYNKESMVLSLSTVKQAIHKLNSKKAADLDTLTAEHLKLLAHSPEALELLISIIEGLYNIGEVPEDVKSNTYKLPIPKKGYDHSYMDNHRGITIPSVIVKLIESIIKEVEGSTLMENQNGLQFGFTKGLSPVMASLLVTEALAEAKHKKQSLFVGSLDARKAFDVVVHSIMKFKLFQSGIKRTTWALIDNMYTDAKERIKWKGGYSRPYNVNQGVKQGGLCSVDYYKLYNNDLPIMMEKAGLGMKIGTVYIGTPICADDTLLLSTNPFEFQGMLNVSYSHSESYYYDLHKVKSVCVTMLKSKADKDCYFTWHLGDKPVVQKESCVHLGQDWKKEQMHPKVDARINKARKTSYAMIGVGVHGHNGLDALASYNLSRTFIMKKLTFGLEAAVLPDKAVEEMAKFYHNQLRIIQTLPQSTSRVAIYLMLGALPLKALYHQQMMQHYGAICLLPGKNKLAQLARRQLTAEDVSPNSWFEEIKRVADIYDIDVCTNMINPASTTKWTTYTSRLIADYHNTSMQNKAYSMDTLKWIIWSNKWQSKQRKSRAHPTWQACRGAPYRVTGASIRMKMLVGRYTLQKDRFAFRTAKDPLCPICTDKEEDIVHMLVKCKNTQHISSPKIDTLRHIYTEQGCRPPLSEIEVTSAILNGWAYKSDNAPTMSHDTELKLWDDANILCSSLCLKLHKYREKAIELAKSGQ